eukprot:scaffold1562_cov146-Isochrysis_galbana.AAC.3
MRRPGRGELLRLQHPATEQLEIRMKIKTANSSPTHDQGRFHRPIGWARCEVASGGSPLQGSLQPTAARHSFRFSQAGRPVRTVALHTCSQSKVSLVIW